MRYYQCDVTDPVSIAEVAKRVRADVSSIDGKLSVKVLTLSFAIRLEILLYWHVHAASHADQRADPAVQINNAGIIRGKTILATTMEEYMLTYKVNFIGCHNILREFLPHSESLISRGAFHTTDTV